MYTIGKKKPLTLDTAAGYHYFVGPTPKKLHYKLTILQLTEYIDYNNTKHGHNSVIPTSTLRDVPRILAMGVLKQRYGA